MLTNTLSSTVSQQGEVLPFYKEHKETQGEETSLAEDHPTRKLWFPHLNHTKCHGSPKSVHGQRIARASEPP